MEPEGPLLSRSLFSVLRVAVFGFTGLLLNHGSVEDGPGGESTTRNPAFQRAIRHPDGDTEVAPAGDVMRQLGLTGEIQLPADPQGAGHFDFSVNRPTDASQVKIKVASLRASVQHFDNGGLATFRIFHTFSGSRFTLRKATATGS